MDDAVLAEEKREREREWDRREKRWFLFSRSNWHSLSLSYNSDSLARSVKLVRDESDHGEGRVS